MKMQWLPDALTDHGPYPDVVGGQRVGWAYSIGYVKAVGAEKG